MERRRAPLENSYWVSDLLVAGEYPAPPGDVDFARERLARLLEAGVRSFINLTEDLELECYEDLLLEEAEARGCGEVRYWRPSIPDADVPTVEHMRAILDLLAREAAEGRCTYVHCWGGVGRTGTVIGCHLVRAGRSGDEALAEVARLFATMSPAKRRWHPTGSPENEAQREFVRSWRESEAGSG